MQSNPQSNPVFWNGFQIQVQSTKKECNQDFAILQSQSYRCLPISAFCLIQIVSKVVPMCFSTPNADGVNVHDDLEHDPELKFEVKVTF